MVAYNQTHIYAYSLIWRMRNIVGYFIYMITIYCFISLSELLHNWNITPVNKLISVRYQIGITFSR